MAIFGVSCAAVNVTTTSRSSIEQLLLVRSLERAIAQFDTQPLAGKMISVEAHGLTGDQGFAKEYITAKLQENKVSVVADPAKADLRLKVFVSALGVDRSERFFGIPAFQAPVVGVPFPEIALFKSVHNRGRTEMQLFTTDKNTQEVVGESEVAVGEAAYDNYKVLLMIDFNVNDLDTPADDNDEPNEQG